MKVGESKNAQEFNFALNYEEENMYEMNIINSEKKHWLYTENHVSECGADCVVYSNLSSHVVPFNRWSKNFVAIGKSKEGKGVNVHFAQGFFGKEAESVPHHVKIDGKVVKLNHLEIKYDELNLMNGFTAET